MWSPLGQYSKKVLFAMTMVGIHWSTRSLGCLLDQNFFTLFWRVQDWIFNKRSLEKELFIFDMDQHFLERCFSNSMIQESTSLTVVISSSITPTPTIWFRLQEKLIPISLINLNLSRQMISPGEEESKRWKVGNYETMKIHSVQEVFEKNICPNHSNKKDWCMSHI